MSKLLDGVVNTAFFVVFGVAIVGAAAPAVASPQCMTQAEARKAFPHDHLYWHTLKQCWDNIGHARSKTPVAKAGAAYAEATQPETSPAVPPAGQPTQADVAEPAKPIIMSPVPFTGGGARGGLFLPVPDAAANDASPRVQEADALPPASVSEERAASQPQDKVVIGAPSAAPGSPEYLLEHCCWPKQAPAEKAQSHAVGHLAAAAGGASGLAAGLWLFFRRRRQPARRRMTPRFGRRTMRVAAEDAAVAAAGVIAIAAAAASVLTARVTAMAASLLRSWSALRDRRAW